MAWDINQIYESVKNIMRKNQAGGISASDLFTTWNVQQRVYMGDLLGRFQANFIGKTGPNTGLITNESILLKLSPFTKNASPAVASGACTIPANLIYTLSVQVDGHECYLITHDQKPFVAKSVIDPPSVVDSKYYYRISDGQFLFLPDTVTQVTVDYVEDVTDVKWDYDIVGGRQVYKPSTSVQPQWDNNSIIDITKQCFVNLGVSFKDGDFSNFGRIAQTTGN